ncbi:MAG: hypothetical protein E7K36_17670, partial [Bacteroides sp.]|nr:hypothetical protein [Bacteroides sp.]
TKSLGNNKAPACESRGFVRKKQKVCILTHLLFLSCISLPILAQSLLREFMADIQTRNDSHEENEG